MPNLWLTEVSLQNNFINGCLGDISPIGGLIGDENAPLGTLLIFAEKMEYNK